YSQLHYPFPTRRSSDLIRVNVLGPGWIETAYGSTLDAVVKERITRSIPLGRWGAPDDIAYAAVYLASEAASYITGQMLLINGGGDRKSTRLNYSHEWNS